MATRGQRNNNPGNIRKSKTPWQGLAEKQDDAEFATFTAPVWGIRAIARTLITYQDQHGCETPVDFIGRWAPSVENDTIAYISDVCRRGNIGRTQSLNVHKYADLKPLVLGIIWHENGCQPYSDAVIDEALRLAGVVKERSQVATVVRDPTVIAGTVATAAASAQATVSSISEIWDTLNKYVDPRFLVWGCVATVIVLGAVYVYQRVQAHKQGLA